MEKRASLTLQGRGLLWIHNPSAVITSHPAQRGDPTHTCSPKVFPTIRDTPLTPPYWYIYDLGPPESRITPRGAAGPAPSSKWCVQGTAAQQVSPVQAKGQAERAGAVRCKKTKASGSPPCLLGTVTRAHLQGGLSAQSRWDPGSATMSGGSPQI